MIRRAATYILAASFALATSRLRLHGHQPQVAGRCRDLRRTLEFGFPPQILVIVVPAGQEFSGQLPDGSKGLTYKTRYGVVGANALGAVAIIDGLNDQGLSIGLFYFPGYAQYAEVTKENASRAPAPQDFGLWVLGNFATVDEVKEAVKDVAVVGGHSFPGLGSAKGMPADAHFFIQDKTGKSIAIVRARRRPQSHRRTAWGHDQRADL